MRAGPALIISQMVSSLTGAKCQASTPTLIWRPFWRHFSWMCPCSSQPPVVLGPVLHELQVIAALGAVREMVERGSGSSTISSMPGNSRPGARRGCRARPSTGRGCRARAPFGPEASPHSPPRRAPHQMPHLVAVADERVPGCAISTLMRMLGPTKARTKRPSGLSEWGSYGRGRASQRTRRETPRPNATPLRLPAHVATADPRRTRSITAGRGPLCSSTRSRRSLALPHRSQQRTPGPLQGSCGEPTRRSRLVVWWPGWRTAQQPTATQPPPSGRPCHQHRATPAEAQQRGYGITGGPASRPTVRAVLRAHRMRRPRGGEHRHLAALCRLCSLKRSHSAALPAAQPHPQQPPPPWRGRPLSAFV